MIRRPRRALAGIALVGAAGLVLTGCGSAPEDDPTSGTGTASSDSLPCVASSVGGFDDQSFNQSALEGLVAGAETIGAEYRQVESTSDVDYEPNLTNLVGQNCTLIVSVGFDLSAATIAAAGANPETNFAIVDDAADADFDGETDEANIKPILFDTAQAAFLAGYAASAVATDKDPENPVVATYGGQNFPTVSVFMDGFAQGVDYYNAQNDSTVGLLGWDREAADGLFGGSFSPGPEFVQLTNGLLDQGADVILPVAGGAFVSSAEAITARGDDVAIIGVDADVFNTAPNYADLYLTSVLKNIATAVEEVVVDEDAFDTTPYLGTLENDGVGLAPWHEYEDRVPEGLDAELDEIRAGIIDGTIPVESYLD